VDRGARYQVRRCIGEVQCVAFVPLGRKEVQVVVIGRVDVVDVIDLEGAVFIRRLLDKGDCLGRQRRKDLRRDRNAQDFGGIDFEQGGQLVVANCALRPTSDIVTSRATVLAWGATFAGAGAGVSWPSAPSETSMHAPRARLFQFVLIGSFRGASTAFGRPKVQDWL